MGALLISLLLAQPANPYLDEGRRLARELKFSEALQQLKVAREVPGIGAEQMVEVLELSARCHVAEGRRAQAEAAYTELLTLSPSFTPEASLSPKILEVFDAAKARLFPRDYLALVPETSPPGWVRVRVVDPWKRAESLVALIGSDDEAYRLTEAQLRDHVLAFTVDTAPRRGLRWRVEARDESGGTIASSSGEVVASFQPTVPLVLDEPPDEAPAPRVQRVFPWVCTGLAVAAVAAGTALQVHSQQIVANESQYADEKRAQRNQARAEAQASVGVFVAAGVIGVVAVVGFAW